jgi:uncharacterized integral membrane protein (TIGR00698 family)
VLAGSVLPLLGPAVFALLLGIVARNALPVVSGTIDVAKVGTRILQLTIVLLGLSVNVVDVLTVARDSLPVMLGTLAVGLLSISLIGRRIGVDARIRTLIAVGTSICGASAIAAVAPAVSASAAEISYAVSVIFLYNIVAVVVFPVLGHALGFSAQSFGLWAGTAVNDTSSVLAAGFAFGAGAATIAAVVKLSRTLMILPVTLLVAVTAGGSQDARAGGVRRTVARALPWFMVAFLLATAVNGLGFMPEEAVGGIGSLASLGTVLALSAIGLSTDLRLVRRTGPRPLLLGLVGWLAVAGTSLRLQAAL